MDQAESCSYMALFVAIIVKNVTNWVPELKEKTGIKP
jgi:hypothetical protein